ncbi:DUF4003 family protein [Jeotgalibacillus proteolyticus]|uniref:DUF4003 domain-containing protein n=1 Tax=Jeotgalibacillus proteolyticus TaxID=2082395 RepID=A0A2S5GCD6_9BACL|nr:DUF4003 family protein [Jeotgalibacillus proteolyticus]PPA70670.1 hypothetical protein C4B60_07675 [Jeotgalibacillus proteolyticus]
MNGGAAVEYSEQIQQFTEYYEALRQKYKWRVDNGVLMMIASQYAGSGYEFDLQAFTKLADYIKEESSAFSYVQSSLRYSLAGLLLNQPKDPKASYKEIQRCYDSLIEAGFQRSPHSYIAAYALFMSLKEDDRMLSDQVVRAKEMYDGIKKQHFFLTSHEDYPLSVLLAEEEGEMNQLLDDMAYYYEELHVALWKGNNRQFVSQILTYGKHENREVLVQNFVTWVDDLKTNKIRLRGLHLPIVGVLSLVGPPSALLPKIIAIYEQLISVSKFKWYKDHCFMIAVRVVILKELEDEQVLNAGLASTVESILQAQQAAVIATMTAATAATSSQGNQ